MANKGRSVLITGCSSGIGKALAIEFHSKGLHVFAASRSVASMKELSVAGVEILQLDPTNAASILSARDHISKRTGGKLDILINNAGQWLEKPAIETSLESAKAIFDINFFAIIEMNNAFLPLLLPAEGVVVNHGSMVRSLAHPFTATYNASKAAVSQYSNTLRIELEPLGVRVVELVSGRITTGLITVPEISEGSVYKPLEETLKARAKEAESQQKPEVFAKAVVKSLLEIKPKAEVFKGNLATMAWVLTTFLPRWALDAFLRTTVGLGNAKVKAEIAERAVEQLKL